MVAGDIVGQQRKVHCQNRLTQTSPVDIAVAGELQQELPVMAAMGQVINISRNYIAIGSWHEDG
jgi:hypothetical protein